MNFTVDQILALAPDASAAAAGRKLGTATHWRNLGRSARALWGECQGSALYQVRIDLSDLTAKCSCPSRKFPCKHGLGLLLLAASTPGALVEGTPPEWVTEWLDRRAFAAERKEARATTEKEPDPVAQAKRGEQRLARVGKGLDALDVWLSDLVRNGLAGVESQPTSVWENQAARLVDAQAPGLASRIRRLAFVAGASPDWPRRLLDELGRVALLTHAFRRLEALPSLLQADVRQLMGWSLTQEEVASTGTRAEDDWILAGQRVDDDEKIRTQRNWLVGARTGQNAFVLQFAAGGAPFPESLIPGTAFEGELVFWPSAAPHRAMIGARRAAARVWAGRLPGSESVEAFLISAAEAAARQPWTDRIGASLRNVVPVRAHDGAAFVRDATGAALRLADADHWRLLAVSGGAAVDLAGEWDGERLLPLGAVVDGAYRVLWKGAA